MKSGEQIKLDQGLVERPDELGAGAVALLGYDALCNPQLRGALCAFDAEGDIENPVWKRRVKTDDILPSLRDLRHATAQEFHFQHAWVFDVFPEQAGEEVVAVFARGSYSQRVIQIYDLSGELLYQVWHDGSVHSCYWMSDARLLVFAGDAHWPYHDAHGSLLGDKVKDLVVFALRPALGFIARDDYLDYTSSKPGDDRLDPAWYLRLDLPSWPEDAVEVAERIMLRPPGPTNDPGRCVDCVVHVDDRVRANVAWVINEFGERLGEKPLVNDEYRSNQNLADSHPDKLDLPDPNVFKLVPFGASESTLSESAPDGASGSSDVENDAP
ncbi:MAG TPA: hypothetical protein VM487_07805 [Phycisphaerae bacterium]|nr:hypothetical protein [Phycisphaerae bacterium]